MNVHSLIPVLRRAALAVLLCLPAAAATPSMVITIDNEAIMQSRVEVGFLKDSPADNAVIKMYEGASTTGDVDITMRLTQKGDVRSATLTHAGTYTLSFSGFLTSCSPRLYLTLPDLAGASYVALFTAKGDVTSSRITLKDIVCDNNAKKYIQFQSDGSIRVTAPK
jgi:hypothetical protein